MDLVRCHHHQVCQLRDAYRQSVLSALEGVEQIAPSLQAYVLPASVVDLFALFAVQPLGTGKIGRAFGPIMLAWFTVMAVLGVYGITQHFGVVAAINPLYGTKYLANGGTKGFLVLWRSISLRDGR